MPVQWYTLSLLFIEIDQGKRAEDARVSDHAGILQLVIDAAPSPKRNAQSAIGGKMKPCLPI